MEPSSQSWSRRHDAYAFPAGTLVRRVRRRRRVALSGAARDSLVLVSDLAGPAGGAGRRQQARRRAAARPQARRCRAHGTRLRPGGPAHVSSFLRLGHQGCRGHEVGQPRSQGGLHRRQGRGRSGGKPERIEGDRFRRRQRVRFHDQGNRRGARLGQHHGLVLPQRRGPHRAQRGAPGPGKHGCIAFRDAGLQA